MRSLSSYSSLITSVALLLTVAAVTVGQGTQTPEGTKASVAGLKVSLTTNKSTYHSSEEVRVVITVENVSEASGRSPAESCIYVENHLSLGYTDTGASLDVLVFDEHGNKVPHLALAADAFGVPDNIVQVIATRYLPLPRGNFLGLKTALHKEMYQPLAKPGRYKLVAEYSNGLHEWLTNKHLEELKKLPCRIWAGPARSEPVWIEVRR